MLKLIFFLYLTLLPMQLQGVDNNPIEFNNTVLEQQYQELIEELRCVMCKNQTVADSNAGLAQDIRDIVRNKILEGQTDQQIKDFLVERYGDFILYNPPLKPKTYVLWWGPLLLVLIAFGVLVYFIRRHGQNTVASPTLTTEERNKIKQILGE